MSEIKVYDEVVYKPIEELKPYENNARVNGAAIKALVKSLPTTGFNVPVVITSENVIVSGHSRYEALKKLGIKEVPCIVVEGGEEENAEARLLDNRVSEYSEWDNEKLNLELRELPINLREMDIDVPVVRLDSEAVLPVTQDAVTGAQDKLLRDDILSKGRKRMIEVHCGHCGETFFVSEEEAEKYAE